MPTKSHHKAHNSVKLWQNSIKLSPCACGSFRGTTWATPLSCAWRCFSFLPMFNLRFHY